MMPLLRNAVLLQVLGPDLRIHLLSHWVIGFYYAAVTAPSAFHSYPRCRSTFSGVSRHRTTRNGIERQPHMAGKEESLDSRKVSLPTWSGCCTADDVALAETRMGERSPGEKSVLSCQLEKPDIRQGLLSAVTPCRPRRRCLSPGPAISLTGRGRGRVKLSSLTREYQFGEFWFSGLSLLGVCCCLILGGEGFRPSTRSDQVASVRRVLIPHVSGFIKRKGAAGVTQSLGKGSWGVVPCKCKGASSGRQRCEQQLTPPENRACRSSCAAVLRRGPSTEEAEGGGAWLMALKSAFCS